jgi:hypothetical protein
MNSKLSQDQLKICDLFEVGPIAYHVDLAHFLGSIEEAILLFQLAYLQGKGNDPEWTYKTVTELQRETALSRHKQDTAIKRLIAKGFLLVDHRGYLNKRHFRVDVDKLCKAIASKRLSGDLVSRNSSNKFAGKRLTHQISKNTQRLTTKEKVNRTHYQYMKKQFFEDSTKSSWNPPP